jgi:hypothetical protein
VLITRKIVQPRNRSGITLIGNGFSPQFWLRRVKMRF